MWESVYQYMDILGMTQGTYKWTHMVKDIVFQVSDHNWQLAHVKFIIEERKYCFNFPAVDYVKPFSRV